VFLQYQEEERRRLQERLDQMALELERARMALEDARSSLIPHGYTGYRTWREFALTLNEHNNYLQTDIIQPALDLVEEAAAQHRAGQTSAAYNTIQDARRVLVQESDEDEEEEDGEDSEEEAEED
jgi:hypothetical protein